MHKYLYELCHLQDQQTAECQRKIGFLHCLGYDAMYFSKKVPKVEEEPAAFISYPEDEGSRLLQNVGAYVLK